jgi:hypothetical protein
MTDRETSPMLPLLKGVVCIVIILWGISRTSHLVGLALLSILLACSFFPLPEWLMQRFQLGKNSAVGVAVGPLGSVSLVTVFSVWGSPGERGIH